MTYSVESLLEKALQAAGKINQTSARCAALTQIAGAYHQNGETTRCAAILVEALKTADTLKYPHEKAKSLAAIARVLVNNGQADQAHQQFSRAVLLARAAESPYQTVEALLSIARAYHEVQINREPHNLLEELHKLVVEPDNGLDSAAELVNIAELYDDLGQQDQAASVLNEALTIAEKIPDKWFRMERLIEIAESYGSTGWPEKAIPVLNQAVSLVSEIEEYSRPYFLLRLAEVNIFLDKKSEAVKILKTIPSIILAEETVYEKAGGLIEVAERYLEIGENISAVELLVQAIVLSDTIVEPKEKIVIQTEAAEWLDEAGHLDQARELADRVYTLCQQLPDKKASIFSLGNLAILFVYLQDSARAAQIIENIIRIVQETAAKTAGLGAIGMELAAEGQDELAMRLAGIIKEPHVLAGLYISLASQGRTFRS